MSSWIDEAKQRFRYGSPSWVFRPSYRFYNIIHPGRRSGVPFPSTTGWGFYSLRSRNTVYSPRLDLEPNSVYQNRMVDKYTMEGFVVPEANDFVVDIGAFVGAFSLGIADKVNHVTAIEPSPHPLSCLLRNISREDNIDVYQLVASNEMTRISLNVAPDPTDTSTLDIDQGIPVASITTQADRIDNIFSDRKVIDFLKCDAEGAEPEVIEGASDIRIRKAAVDCRPERDLKNTVEPVQMLFEDYGMETRTRGNMVFAREPK